MQKLDNDSAEKLAQLCADKRPKAFLCIGDPSHNWDSYAPMVGSLLKLNHNVVVFGSIECPINSYNVEKAEEKLRYMYPEHIIVAIDAASTNIKNRKGKINIHDYGVKPGEAFSKDIREVGDYCVLFGVDHSDINNRLVKNPFLAALETYEVLKSALEL